MPYKNIEDRRKAWKRWKNNNLETHKRTQRIQAMARYYHPIKKTCSVENCQKLGERHHPDYSKPKEIIWLCKGHHEETHHTRICEVDNCGGFHRARGMCSKHYNRWRRA
jgi:hypothetical protein